MTTQDLIDFYIKLLSLPTDNVRHDNKTLFPAMYFRLNNQALYASVRDAIAYQTNMSSEEVQTYFEDYVMKYK